jgi:adenylate cyclase class 2
MKEIEIKIINVDVNAFREKIVQLDAKKIFAGDVSSSVLDYKDSRLSKKDSLLRLRSFSDKHYELTFKGRHNKGRYKVREEINIIISEYDDALNLLKKLGLKITKKIYKFRESYELVLRSGKKKIKYHIDIDDYKIIPEFIEIAAKNIKELAYILKMLKIPKKNLYNGSTQGLFDIYGIKQNL